MEPSETLSVIVLTKDEEHNLPECLDALLPQLGPRDEIIVVDSASRDRTVDIARAYAARSTASMRVHAYTTNVSFGAARNRGIEMAGNDVVVMLSADAAPEPGWAAALRDALRNADIVYGSQRHAPTRQNAATVSRGLRYHIFEADSGDALPEQFASNVNAAYRKLVFTRLRFDEHAAGSEDVAFAREARLEGFRIAYAPRARVGHKDVSSFRAEWRKHAREGAAHAQLRKLLGAPRWHLAWAVGVAGLALIGIVAAEPLVVLGALAAFFAPALRRAATPVARNYAPMHLASGVLASPLFDLAFVGSYLTRRVRP